MKSIKRTISVILAALCLGLMLMGAAAPATKSVSTVSKTVTVGKTATTTSKVHLRSAASTTSKSLLQVPNGKTVTVQAAAANGWYKVKYGSKVGYILGTYLKGSGTTSSSSSSSSSSKNSKIVGVVGHIKMPNTKIDYNIMLAKDNKFFIDHDEKGKADKAGAIFLDVRNADKNRQRNLIVYGHNMKNETMFRHLHKYNTKSFFDANKDIEITVFGKKYKYRVFAAGDYKIANFKYRTQFTSGTDFANYVNNDIMKGAKLKASFTATANDQIVTLSTCINDRARRWIVFAYRVSEIK